MSDVYPDTEGWKKYYHPVGGGSEFIGNVAFRNTVFANNLTGCQVACWDDASTFVKGYSAQFLGELDAGHLLCSLEKLKPSGCTVVADLSCSPVEEYPHQLRGLYSPSRDILWEGIINGPDAITFQDNLNNSPLSSFGSWVVSANLISVTGGPDDIRFMAFTDGVFTDTIKTHSDCASAGVIWDKFEKLVRCVVVDTDDQIAKEVYVDPDNLCSTSAINVQSVIENIDAGLCDVTTTVRAWSGFWLVDFDDQSASEVPYTSVQDALISAFSVQGAVDQLEDKVYLNCQQLSSTMMTVSADDGTSAELLWGDNLIFVSPDNTIDFSVASGSAFVSGTVNLNASQVSYTPVCIDLSANTVQMALGATEQAVCDLQNTVNTFSADNWVTELSSVDSRLVINKVDFNDWTLGLDLVYNGPGCLVVPGGQIEDGLSAIEVALCDVRSTVSTFSADCWQQIVSSVSPALTVSAYGCHDYTIDFELDPDPTNQARLTPSGLMVDPTEFLGIAGIVVSGVDGIELTGTGSTSDPLIIGFDCCECVEDIVDVLYEKVMVCFGPVSAGDVCIDLTKQFVDSYPLSVLNIYDQDMNLMWEGSIFANTPAELETQLNEELSMFGPWTASGSLICVSNNPYSAVEIPICEEPPVDICFIELANGDGTKQDIIPIEILNPVVINAPIQGNLPLWTKFSELIFRAFVFGDELAAFTGKPTLPPAP